MIILGRKSVLQDCRALDAEILSGMYSLTGDFPINQKIAPPTFSKILRGLDR